MSHNLVNHIKLHSMYAKLKSINDQNFDSIYEAQILHVRASDGL